MIYRNFLQRHKNTARTQNFSPTLYHFENTVRNGLSAYLLIRWSRVRVSPDPPLTAVIDIMETISHSSAQSYHAHATAQTLKKHA